MGKEMKHIGGTMSKKHDKELCISVPPCTASKTKLQKNEWHTAYDDSNMMQYVYFHQIYSISWHVHSFCEDSLASSTRDVTMQIHPENGDVDKSYVVIWSGYCTILLC